MLIDDADKCRRKMDAASALINGLAGERERWTEQSKEYKAQIGRYAYNNELKWQFNSINALKFAGNATKCLVA